MFWLAAPLTTLHSESLITVDTIITGDWTLISQDMTQGGIYRPKVQKIGNFSPISRRISQTVQDSHNDRLIGSPIRAFDWYQNHRPWITLNGLNALCCKKMRALEPTAQI